MTYVSIHVSVLMTASRHLVLYYCTHATLSYSSIISTVVDVATTARCGALALGLPNHHYALCIRSGPTDVALCVHTLRTNAITMTMLFLCGLLQSHAPGLHPWVIPCVLGVHSIQSTVAIATPRHSE